MNSDKDYDENEDSDYFSDFISSSENIFESDSEINDEMKILKIMIINEQIMIINNSVINHSSAVRTFVNEHNTNTEA